MALAAMYDIILYAGTGFDSVNIPDSPATLEAAAVNTYTVTENHLTQNINLTSIRVNGNMSIYQAVDYIKISPNRSGGLVTGFDAYYSVTGITALTDRTIEFNISMDYFLTMGGVDSSDFENFTATATRITPEHSAVEYNYLEEPFKPAETMKLNTFTSNYPNTDATHTTEHITVIGATVDLNTLKKTTARAILDGDGNTVGYFPELPQVVDGTKVRNNIPGSTPITVTYELPNEKLYYFSSNPGFQKMLNVVQSLGISDSIIDRVVYPSRWVTVGISLDAAVPNVEGRKTEDYFSVSYNPPGITGSFKNKKTQELYKKLVITSNLTGDTASYGWGEVCESDGKVYISGFADASPKGRPYVGPKKYMGMPCEAIEQKVQGAQWYSPQMTMTGSAGSLIRKYETGREIADVNRALVNSQISEDITKRQYGLSQAGRGVSAVIGGITGSGVLGAVQGMMQGELAYEDAMRAEAYNRTNLYDRANDIATATNMANSIYTPSFKSAEGSNLSLCVPNTFKISAMNISENDMLTFDRYLTKFGYAVPGESITKDDLKRGKNFCYIVAGEISFNGGGTAKFIRNGCIAQLMNGVRIWHKKPSATYYEESNDPAVS